MCSGRWTGGWCSDRSAARQLFVIQLAVGGGSRVDDQTLHISNVCQQREDLQVIDKLECFLAAAFDVEGEDGSPPLGKYFSYRA